EKWNKKNPEWNEESKLFPVYAMCQLITLRIFDKDNLSWHDEIGEVRRIEVQDAIKKKEEQDYQLYDAKGKQIPDSFVRLSFDYKVVGQLVKKPTGADDTLFVLLVAVDKLRPEKSYELQDTITLSYRIDAEGEVLEQEGKKKPEILDKEKEQMKFVRNVLRKLE
ncbi:SYT4, partial [Symbiodinium microadriaticum]